MADCYKRCTRGQEPKVDATFPYRAPDDLIADAVHLGGHPRKRVDRKRVAAKDGDHAQRLGIERSSAGARTDSNPQARMIVKSSIDLGYPLGHERSVIKSLKHRVPRRNHDRAETEQECDDQAQRQAFVSAPRSMVWQTRRDLATHDNKAPDERRKKGQEMMRSRSALRGGKCNDCYAQDQCADKPFKRIWEFRGK